MAGGPPGASVGPLGTTGDQPTIFFCSDRRGGSSTAITTVGAHRDGRPGTRGIDVAQVGSDP